MQILHVHLATQYYGIASHKDKLLKLSQTINLVISHVTYSHHNMNSTECSVLLT